MSSIIKAVEPDTSSKRSALARAVKDAQALANADRRPYLVTRGPRREAPYVTSVAGLEALGAIIVEGVAAGTTLVVAPVGMYYGLTGAEIIAADVEIVTRG